MNHRGWRIGILGAGNWGTALAHLLARQGHEIRIWAYETEVVDGINRGKRNPLYLEGITLPDNVLATEDPMQAVARAEMLLFVIPAQFMRMNLKTIAGVLPPRIPLVICSKGIERQTLATMDQVFRQELAPARHEDICVLSGPSFAAEVARGTPTNVTLACSNIAVARTAQGAIACREFRVYTTDDLIGVEIGGSLKNVMAIAVGASDALGFGHNTRAGLVTRGLAELSRLAVDMGARPETMLGLAGVGDLILTCMGDLSRNRTVGKLLAQGYTRDQILGRMNMVAEGIPTTESAFQLSRRRGLELPITEQVYRVLYENKTVSDAIKALQDRPLKAEWDA